MMDDSFQDVSIRSFEVYQDGTFEKLESRNENKKMEKKEKKKKKKSKQPTFADEEYLESTFQTSTLQANHQLGKSSQIMDKEIFASGSIWREPDAASSSVLIFQDEKMQLQGPSVANSRVSLDSDWNSSINLSVVSDELSSKLTNELTNVASEYHKETNTTLKLLVGYLVSMGTDLHTSENLAMSFMTQEGMLDKIQGHTSLVQKSQSRDSNRSSQGFHKIPLKQSYLASPYLRESATNDLFPADEETSQDAGLVNQPVAQATEVLDCEIEMPIVYAETSKIGFKDLVKERPIKLALMVGILGLFLLVGGIVAAVVYKTKTVGPDLVETNLPSMSPSNSPTMIQDDILLAAIQLSGEEPLLKSSSPQFLAVAWMSNFDTSSVYDIREAFAQRYAMVVLFYSFAGEEWINKENWLNPLLHECDWSAGISCSDKAAGGRLVTGLDATRNNLQGSIPPEIDLLPALQTLHLPNNKIRGTIPSTLGRMGSLSTLDCSYNEIEGSIPSSIGSATNLLSIDFSQNRLHGTLPQEIFSLTNLQTVTLPSNFLTGSLPEALQDSQALVTLDLRNNLFTGVFPLNLDSISALARIYLDYNQLTGKIPYLTAELAQMEVISIGHNSFTGNLELSPDFDLANIANLISDFRLKYVDASYNMLSGPISVIFGFLPTMRFFDVSGNNFTGSFPSAVGWDGIEYIAAAQNKLTGTLPVGYPTLTHFDMSGNQFHGSIPDALCEYEDLKYLNLSRNQIGWTIPECLGSLPPLQTLDISNNLLSGSIPSFLGQLIELELMKLNVNNLTGLLPSQLGNLLSIREMSISDNGLAGTLPLELGKLTKLISFQASNNALTGVLPSEISAWVNLERLELFGNPIGGSIPPELCQIDDLELLTSDIGCNIQCDCCTDSSCWDNLQR